MMADDGGIGPPTQLDLDAKQRTRTRPAVMQVLIGERRCGGRGSRDQDPS